MIQLIHKIRAKSHGSNGAARIAPDVATQGMYLLAPQWSLDQSSAFTYLSIGNMDRAKEHLGYVYTSPDYWTGMALGAMGGSVLGRGAALEGAAVKDAAGGVGVVKEGIAEGNLVPPAGSIKNVNPTGGDMNCVNCIVATDATLRGNPASALPGGPYTLPVLEQHFGSKFRTATLSDIEKNLLQQGNGATGVIYGYPPAGSNVGHVFTVVNQNGVIRYLDGQTGVAANAAAFPKFQFMPLPKIGG